LKRLEATAVAVESIERKLTSLLADGLSGDHVPPVPKEGRRASLTAKAKAYLKHDKAKSVTVKLVVTARDPAGNHRTFTRTLKVLLHKHQKRKRKHKH